MKDSIKDYCFVNDAISDRFVGIKSTDGKIEIHLPLGYSLLGDENYLRKDILNVFKILQEKEKEDSKIYDFTFITKSSNLIDFPIQSYIFIIKDYLSRGKFKVKKINYCNGKNGRILWNKTIQKEIPYIQDDNFYFLNFIVAKNDINNNELISKIYEYCLYQSIMKIGWLFGDIKVNKPNIGFNKNLFKVIINRFLENTFNNEDILLFKSMLNIVDSIENEPKNTNWFFGTYYFEYIWEYAIDKVFGINNKKDYFPKTEWNIKIDRKTKVNNPLMPDTIMFFRNNIYVLDAKYYKYGITGKATDLPATSSIYKQIVYGEFIFNKHKKQNIYSVFLLPCDESLLKDPYIGYAKSTNKSIKNLESYEYVHSILLDTRKVLNMAVNKYDNEILKFKENIVELIIENNPM